MEKEAFWIEAKEQAKKNNMDEVLAYMQLMLRKAREKRRRFNKTSLREHGGSLSEILFPGVENWFDEIKQYSDQVTIEHYIISSGLDEMIKGSSIGQKFEHVYASGFFYDENDVPEFPARSINYTTKVQYLFRINKGIRNSWDNTEINNYTPEEERPIPFSQMIYIGDGYTDVPCMKMINHKGGYSIAVYPPKEGERRTRGEAKEKRDVENLKKDNRCQFIAEADYTKDKELYRIVTSLIDRIANERKYSMNLEAK